MIVCNAKTQKLCDAAPEMARLLVRARGWIVNLWTSASVECSNPMPEIVAEIDALLATLALENAE